MRSFSSAAVVLAVTLVLAAGVPAASAVKNLSVEQARELLEKQGGKLVVLDVRTPGEFDAGHLKGATNVNVMAPDFESRVSTLDRGKEYLVYCRTGNRSERAVQTLTRLGFTKLHHMTEGIVGWQAKRLPLVR
jgi:rhodanese-related sulfurtransferase